MLFAPHGVCFAARDCGLVGESVVAEVGRRVLLDVALI